MRTIGEKVVATAFTFSVRKKVRIQYFLKKFPKMTLWKMWKSTQKKQLEGLGALKHTQWNRKGFFPQIANMLFVSINFSLEKVFARFSFVNSSFVRFELNKFAYMGWNVICEETGIFSFWQMISQVFNVRKGSVLSLLCKTTIFI